MATDTTRSARRQRWIAEVMDLCLSCKACKTECPSNVDLAKLKAEFLQAYYEHRMRPLGPPAGEEHPPAQPARGAVRRA